MANLSFVNLTDATAKVTCTCGWESAPFHRSPFDPAESLAGMSTEHVYCQPSSTPEKPAQIDLKELDLDLVSTGITDQTTRLAFTVFAKHVNAELKKLDNKKQ